MQSGAKILIVDDEEEICQLTKLMLEKEGYNVAVAKSGNEGIERAIKEKPDGILLDVMLPDGNGWDVCRELKSREETKRIPVAMFSVRSEKEEKDNGFYYFGCDLYIEKPFTRSKIISGVKTMMNHR